MSRCYNLVTPEGEVFTWAPTEEEADKRCTRERVVFGRILLVGPATETTCNATGPSRAVDNGFIFGFEV